MNLLVLFSGQVMWQALGLTLLHFIWQGTAVAALLAITLLLLKRANANSRYGATAAALLLMFALPLLTFGWLIFSSATTLRNDAGAKVLAAAVKSKGEAAKLSDEMGNGFAQLAPEDAAWVGRISWQGWNDARSGFVLKYVAMLWLAGALLFSLRLILNWSAAQHLAQSQTKPLPVAWQASLKRLSKRLGVKRVVRLYESARVEVPTVIGCLKPVILVPASALVGMSAPQLEALLAHELAHIRRHDYLLNLLQSIVETLLFYHPAVWWVSRRMRVEREHCCDDLAVWACGDLLTYAHALAELEQLRTLGSTRIAMAADGGSLLKRIRRLVEIPSPQPTRPTPLIACIIFIITALLGVMLGAQTARVSSQLEAGGATSLSLHTTPHSRKVAVSFVSLPTYRGINEPLETTEATTRKLLQSLYVHHVPAIGFVGERRLGHDPNEIAARANILRLWLDAGLELGNETYSHPYLYKTPLEAFEADVVRGEKITSALLKEHGRELKYFSYPFLNTGANPAVKAEMEKFLAACGYTIAPITIDNMDWLFSRVYNEARERSDVETMRRVGEEYVPYMERMVEFYEQLSRDVVGYEVPQVLLLTTSALNADKFDELAEMLKRRGYDFVSLDEALKDDAYKQPDTYTGAIGCSWLQRWAITKGGEFRKEPALPLFVRQFDPVKDSGSDLKTGVK